MTKKKNGTSLTPAQIGHLLHGYNLIAFGKPEFASDEERREAWFANREFLLSLKPGQKIPGLFGGVQLKRGQKPEAWKRYEGSKSGKGAAGRTTAAVNR
jgi:hypothetical protein